MLKKADYPELIPKSWREKIDASAALSAQFEFNQDELDSKIQNIGLIDPIGDKTYMEANGIIHRYKNRILFSPVSRCPINCRYCFRKNELFEADDNFAGKVDDLENYLLSHPEINEVILTGGDPLMISNAQLEKIALIVSDKKIPYFRIHSRTPVILPARINTDFLALSSKLSQLFTCFSIAIHINHLDESGPELNEALTSLSTTGAQLMAQTVLLKGVNDNSAVLSELFTYLIGLKVRPYYLHHPDLVKGAMHFWLPLEQGRLIYNGLKDLLPGWAIPQYVVDIPGGHGKVAVPGGPKASDEEYLIDRHGHIHSYLTH